MHHFTETMISISEVNILEIDGKVDLESELIRYMVHNVKIGKNLCTIFTILLLFLFHKPVLSLLPEYQIDTITNELKFNWTWEDKVYNLPSRDFIQTFYFNYYNGILPTRSQFINVPEVQNIIHWEKKP